MRCLGSIDINNITYPLAQLSDYSFIRSTEDFRWVYKDGSATQQYISSAGTDFIPVLKPYPTTFGESAYKPFSNYRAKFEYWSYRNQSGPQDLRIGVRIDDEENTILSSAGWGYDDSYLRLYVAIVLDDTNECGYIIYSYYVQGENPEEYADGYGMCINGGNSTSGRLIYDIFGYNGGGAGSGYIGNSLLSNKKMVGYNVPTSSAEGTKTESVNDVSASAVSGKPKSGNGFARIKFLREITSFNYGFHIEGSDENDVRVSYLEDSIGKTPVYMDFTNDVFNYGDWGNAFFLPKPCILGQDGIVQTYLNPNDYSKDVNGNSVTIDSNLSGANVMIEFPKIYCKIVPDTNTKNANIYISNEKLDNDYHDYAYISKDKTHREHFYRSAYGGSYINNVLRSLSNSQIANNKTVQTFIDAATANNSRHYIETIAQVQLINFLLILMAKSVNMQSVYGMGLCSSGSEALCNAFRSGVHNSKGLFYGTNSGAFSSYSNAVKVFGIENYWGLVGTIHAGDIGVASQRIKYKMCWGQEDGSTTDDFNLDGTNYIDTGVLFEGISGGNMSAARFTDYAMIPYKGSNSSGYDGDAIWCGDSSGPYYAWHCGYATGGSKAGAFMWNRGELSTYARWLKGASLTYI